MIVYINDISITLTAHKVFLCKRFDALFIADLHLGKTASFSQLGVALPKESQLTTLDRFQNVLDTYRPKNCYILGDLFHNKLPKNNLIDDQFQEFLDKNKTVNFYLTTGNHDSKHNDRIQKFSMQVKPFFELGPFILSHKFSSLHPNKTQFIGHHHPGIKLQKRGFSKLTLPCFFMKKNLLICPAFGDFTGLRLLSSNQATKVVAILDGKRPQLYEL